MWLLSLAGALIAGTVTLTDATGAVLAAPGVRVTLACAAATEPHIAVSDDDGVFRFVDLAADTCSLTTDLQGFVGETTQTVVHRDETVSVALQMVTVPIRIGIIVARPAATPTAGSASRRKGCANTCRR